MTSQNNQNLNPDVIARLPYNPYELARELKPNYISATKEEIDSMLESVGMKERKELFAHLDPKDLFDQTPDIGEALAYDDLVVHLEELAAKNNLCASFIGDGLKWGAVHPIVEHVSNIRGLTTAYTPYQPERSQGTLHTLWIYASALAQITGFEAINASLYERSTGLYEALNTATRIKRGKNKVIVSEGIYPGDWEVLKTLASQTELEIIPAPLSEDGLIDMALLEKLVNTGDIAGFAFPQTNHLGLLEDVHTLTAMAHQNDILAIGIIDPLLYVNSGLTPPAQWNEVGCDMIVGEAQHLAIGPNFGGPGLGLFGIRYNENNKTHIRSTAGRFVGKGKDESGEECLLMVLSTREQHIRREKATSNICSNQSFLATLVGASLLAKGEKGLEDSLKKSREGAMDFAHFILEETSLSFLYEHGIFFNEVAIEIPHQIPAQDLILKASEEGLHIGVDITERDQQRRNSILFYFNDAQSDEDREKLKSFLRREFPKSDENSSEELTIAAIPPQWLRNEDTPVGLPNLELSELKAFYDELGQMNVSPDDAIYPLGSCTMKYNPYINDYAAGLKGFTDIHPQAPLKDAQGCLEVLYETQELFKTITGLKGVTTQPVAGAQGELVGIKMFQAYHRDRGNGVKKDIILIPASAHGTNPATATMAGYITKGVGAKKTGIVTINANSRGEIDFDQLKELVDTYSERIAGIMITNPNTSGIFESRFREIADLIHSVDGLVYMDGANMNAIASWVDLDKLGVDAIHNNLHKTWTIPHGGGGPGDAIVAVSEKLIDYLPGIQVEKSEEGIFSAIKPPKSIGSIHRHFGNFAHKIRSYTYIKALGSEGVREMSAIAVLSAVYLYKKLKNEFPTLPAEASDVDRMHEFILTLSKETFDKAQAAGTPKAQVIAKVGKLFLDFGLHAPTVSFPEPLGLMVEPTESFSKAELDEFHEVLTAIRELLEEAPEVLTTAPHFTPIKKVDEVTANKNLQLSQKINALPKLQKNIVSPGVLKEMGAQLVKEKIIEAHKKTSKA